MEPGLRDQLDLPVVAAVVVKEPRELKVIRGTRESAEPKVIRGARVPEVPGALKVIKVI